MTGLIVAYAGLLLVCLVEEIKHRLRVVAGRVARRKAIFAKRGAR